MKKLIILASLVLPGYLAFSGGDGSVYKDYGTAPVLEPVEIDIHVDKDGEIDLDIENMTAHELEHVIAVLQRHRPVDVEMTLPGDLEDEYETHGWLGPNGEVLNTPLLPVVDALSANGIHWESVEID